MAGFVAPILGLGAGAALYSLGIQGQYKENPIVASGAACAVAAGMLVAQRLCCGTTTTTDSTSASDSKKKKKKDKKAEPEGDATSSSASTKTTPPSDAGKAGNEKPKKGKEEKKAAEPEKKVDKQKAKANPEPAKPEQKTAKKPEAGKGKKGEATQPEAGKKGEPAEAKKGKKGEPAKPAEKTKGKKQEVDEDDDDEEGFLRLGQKTGSVPTRAPVQSDSDEEADEAPTQALSTSKSANRRRRQKENKEKAAAAEAAVAKPKKEVDKDGFETVPVNKKSAKKPAVAAVAESKTDPQKPAVPTAYSDTIELESKQIALLIGPKGETLNALREACGGVRIDTPMRDSGDKKVTISGEEESVKYCKAQIRDLMTKGYCPALNPGNTSANMSVSNLGAVIGPKGVHIGKIQSALGVRIKTPDRGSNSDQITISGPKDNVKKAKAVVQQLIEHGFSSITHEGFEIGEVAFPRAELRHLIGPGGHTIKSIQGDTGTKVKIPAEDAANQNIQVIGPASGVAKAIKQISTLLERKAAKEAAAAAAAEYNSEDED